MNKTDWRAARSTLLGKVSPSRGHYHAHLVPGTNGDRIYVARDEHSASILALKIGVTPTIPTIKSEVLDAYRVRTGDGRWFYCIRLLDSALTDIFDALASDLAGEVDCVSRDEEALDAIALRLKSWEKMFQRGGAGLLSKSEIVGLIGELWFFNYLQSHSEVGSLGALNAWQGPLGADHDFSLPLGDVEVKCTRSDYRYVGISSLEQLEALRPLFLRVHRYRPSSSIDSASTNLNQLVEKCITDFGDEPHLLSLFRDKLVAIGYVSNSEYDKTFVVLDEVNQYRVDDEFPRLTRDSVPVGVAAASYQISMDALGKFLVEEPYCGRC